MWHLWSQTPQRYVHAGKSHPCPARGSGSAVPLQLEEALGWADTEGVGWRDPGDSAWAGMALGGTVGHSCLASREMEAGKWCPGDSLVTLGGTRASCQGERCQGEVVCSHSLVLFLMDQWVSLHCHCRNGIGTFSGAWQCHTFAPGACKHFKPTRPAAGLLTLPRRVLRSQRGKRGAPRCVPPREGHGDVLPSVNARCPGTSTLSGEQRHPERGFPAFSRAVLCRAVLCRRKDAARGSRGDTGLQLVAHRSSIAKAGWGTAALGNPGSKHLLKPSEMSAEAFFSDSHHLGSLGRDRDLQGSYSQPEQKLP